MSGIINPIVELAKGINAFQFNYASHQQGELRLVKALGEFLVQSGVEVDENAEDCEGNHCIALHKSQWAEDEGHTPMFVIDGTNVIAIPVHNAVVFLRADGNCMIVLGDCHLPGGGDGGYFSAQTGTAFGRVLGQGFTPTDIDCKNIWPGSTDENGNIYYNDLLTTWYGSGWDDLEEVTSVYLCTDGHLEFHTEGSPSVYCVRTAADQPE